MCNVFKGTIRICIEVLDMCYMQLQLPAKVKKSTKATQEDVNASTDATSEIGSSLLRLLVLQN